MKVKGSKVLAILLIAVVFLIGMELNLQNEVQAAQQMVRITKSWVNIRSSASLNSSVIKVVPMNSTYPYKGQTGDFYQIDFNGRKAYVHKSVSEKFTPSNSSGNVIGKVTINVSVGNIRNAASLSSKVIGQAYRNQTFDVVGTSGSFYKIKYGKTTAYVHNSIVKYAAAGSGGSGSGSSSNNSSKNETVIGKVTIDVKTVANIRSGASLSSSVIAKGYPGQVYDVIGKSGDFYKIKLSSSKTAYVHNSVVKFSSSSGSGSSSNNSSKNETVIGKVTIDVKTVANIRSGASLNSSVIAKGYPGQVYDVIGKSGDFYKIKLSSSKTAYVHNSVVKFSSSSGSGSSSNNSSKNETVIGKVTIDVKTVANIRSGASLSSSVIAKGYPGQVYDVIGKSGDFYKIKLSSSKTAYVHNSVVKFSSSSGSGSSSSNSSKNETVIGKVTIDVKTVANIRSGASLSSSVIAKGYPGEVYDVIGKSGDFYKIKLSSSKTAYVHNSVVKFSSSSGSGSSSNNSSKNETVIGKVTIDVKTVANIRSGASLNSSVIAKGYPGEVYDVIGKSGDFYKIKLSSSKTAYVHNSVVKFSSSSGSGSSSPKDPPPATEDLGKVKVNVKTVANVRSKPTLADDKTVVGTVKAGEQFNVVAFEGEFFKINTSKYGQVYIHKSVVVYIPPKGEDQLPSFTVVPGSLKGKTVILDAGHGGHSPGAVHFGHLEKDYVLSVALKTKALLEQAGANVIMTRSSDVYVGLFARSAIANRYVMGLEVAKRQKAVDDNRVQASALTKELNNLNNEMSQLIQQYDTAEQELADVNSAIEQLNQDILQAEDDLKAAQNRVDEAKAELAAAEQALEEYREGKQDGDGDEPGDGEGESGDGDESGDEDEPDEEEQELIEAVENAQKALEEAEQAVAECEGRLDDFNAQLEDLKAQKAQLDDIIKNYPQKHTNLQNAINKKNQQLTQLETEYQTLKTQLDRAKYLEQQCKAYIASGSDSRTGIYATANKKDLEEIFEIEKAYQDQVVFISIHMNATGLAQNTTRRGVQAFYFQGNSYYNGYNVSKRKTLATKLYNKLHPAMGLPANSSPINTANFSVLRENNLPAVLLELGYMDNIYDLQELIKDTTHEKAARGIYQGLVDYFK